MLLQCYHYEFHSCVIFVHLVFNMCLVVAEKGCSEAQCGLVCTLLVKGYLSEDGGCFVITIRGLPVQVLLLKLYDFWSLRLLNSYGGQIV